MTEWRTIEGWPRHQVSDDGRVRIATAACRGAPAGTEVCQWIEATGYYAVQLYDRGRKERFTVHRLVCRAFHGEPPTPAHEVGHRNGARLENSASNLRWVTRKENCDDAEQHGTRLRGERQNGAKLTASAVSEIRARAAAGELQKRLASDYGVSDTAIYHVVHRNTWRHI